MLEKLGMPELAGKWPQELLPLGAPVGGLTHAAAAHLGLPVGTLVAQGGADAFVGCVEERVLLPSTDPVGLGLFLTCSFISWRDNKPPRLRRILGLGVVRPGLMALLTGSSHLQLGVVAEPIHGPGIFGTYRDAVVPGTHVIEGGQTSTGSIVNWFKRTLVPPDVGYDELNAEAGAVPPGCEGLACLDHFQVRSNQ